VKRPNAANASKIRGPVHVIESDSDNDNEVVVRGYRNDLFVKEVDKIFLVQAHQPGGYSHKTVRTSVGESGRPGGSEVLPTNKSYPPTRSQTCCH